MPDSQLLHGIRTYMANNLGAFKKAYSSPSFTSHFGELHGAQNKRIDKELREAGEQEPLLYNKQFYYFAELDPKLVEKEGLLKLLMKYYHAGAPVKEFLRQACL